LPAFDRFPTIASAVGRLLAGYGELEFELAHCVSIVTNDPDHTFKKMFGAQGERKRIKSASDLGLNALKPSSYLDVFNLALEDMDHCRKIRNQYAHCTWGEGDGELFFVDLEEIAKSSTPIDFDNLTRCATTAALVTEQLAFFDYVQDCLTYLTVEARVQFGGLRSNHRSLPARVVQPSLYTALTTPIPLVTPQKR